MTKRITALGVLASLAFAVAPSMAQEEMNEGLISLWEWAISESSTDAEATSGAPFAGEKPLYLWFSCAIEAASQATMDLVGSFEFVSFVPESGFTVQTGLPALALDFECQGGPWILAGTLTVRDTTGTGGDVCMGSMRSTTRCPDVYADRQAYRGYSTLGTWPCWGDYCGVDYVDPLSWGKVKAYFESGR